CRQACCSGCCGRCSARMWLLRRARPSHSPRPCCCRGRSHATAG
ncbi:MAG: hypothetical protein AVDCRST_MAG89-3073, partial [uncultured Gemmatimonadetes bacterium]